MKRPNTAEKPQAKKAKLNEPRLVEQHYDWINTVSEGSYGVVHKAKRKIDGQICALKRLKILSREENKILESDLPEMKALIALDHPNVVQIHEILQSQVWEQDVYVAMEFCEYDLGTVMESEQFEGWTLPEVKCIFTQLLIGVKAIHDLDLMHRDLKPHNLLLSSEGIVKICDFGLTRHISGDPDTQYTVQVVTLGYRCPEILLGSQVYGKGLDIWSCGCMLYEFVLRKMLFESKQEFPMVAELFGVLGTPDASIWPEFEELPHVQMWEFAKQSRRIAEMCADTDLMEGGEGFAFLERLLTFDPKQRIKIDDALKHPWVASEEPKACEPSKNLAKGGADQPRQKEEAVEEIVEGEEYLNFDEVLDFLNIRR